MKKSTLILTTFLILLVHGIGHVQGVIAASGVKFHSSTTTQSWLLKEVGSGPNRILCGILFGSTALLTLLAAFSFKGILLSPTAWQSLALAAAFASTASLTLFPQALAMFFNKAGAVAVNLLIFYSILFQQHVPEALFEN